MIKTKDELLAELTKLLHELFEVPVDKVKRESRFYEDLELDSIDAIDLIGQFQTLVGERINPEDFKSVRTVGDVVDIGFKMIQLRDSEN